MKYTKLGSSGLDISQVCLGTMTWGEQNNQDDANQQIEYAIEQGINFLDTAEIYAVPPRPETQGFTEQILGNWLGKNSTKREGLIIATKICGSGVSWIREGSDITADAIKQAVDGSLKRLQTDYIDLYQLHWPNRVSPHFSKHWPGRINYDEMNAAKERESFLEILTALDDCVKAGKIRHCGLSDDTPWGIKEYLNLAEKHDLPRMVSIQNEFSLLHIKDYPYLIETCMLDDVAFLPWSPLAGGILTGKYSNGQIPEGSRWSMPARLGFFRDTSWVHEAVEAYRKVADKHGLSLAKMCLAWVYQLHGVSSTIIGATTMEQLKEDIDAFELSFSDELQQDILDVLKQYPMPF